jgi:hypothetical protein
MVIPNTSPRANRKKTTVNYTFDRYLPVAHRSALESIYRIEQASGLFHTCINRCIGSLYFGLAVVRVRKYSDPKKIQRNGKCEMTPDRFAVLEFGSLYFAFPPKVGATSTQSRIFTFPPQPTTQHTHHVNFSS